MNNIINNLEPKKVFEFFSDICKIPHGSGNPDGIVNCLVNFAKERNLEYITDDVHNVIIKKQTKGGDPLINSRGEHCESVINRRGEHCEPVILQAHTDMVCVKTPDSNIDMSKDPLDVYVDGEYLRARGTSLGADDGIGVAIILAILDDDEVSRPIEALFTSDEETWMNGALGLDGSLLSGKTLINIDSEDEGELTVSCTGGAHIETELPISRKGEPGRRGEHCEPNFISYTLKISGLLGGHSGMEIHKGRTNAIIECAYILKEMLERGIDFQLLSINGGTFENVICSEAGCEILVERASEEKLKSLVSEVDKKLKNEFILTDKGIKAELIPQSLEASPETVGASTASPLDRDSTEKLVALLISIPQGLTEVSQDFINLPWTSLNNGVIKTEKDYISIITFVRSNEDLKKEKLVKKFETIVKSFGARVAISGRYPAWQYAKGSTLIEKMLKTYRNLFNKDMKIVATHGGLECGILIDKISGLEAVSIGPTVKAVHSVDEKLEIKTVKKVYDYIKALL